MSRRIWQHQGGFGTGEVSPELNGSRPDLERYPAGLGQMFNWLCSETGAAILRPGTRHVAAAHDHAKAGRLVPFVFSRDQAYVLEFGDTVMRVFKEDGIVLSGATPFVKTGLPWSSADLAELFWAQSNDQLFLTRQTSWPRTLTRLDHDDWADADFAPDDGPFRDENVNQARTVQASAISGTVTLTATGFIFVAGQIGALFRLAESDLSVGGKQWVGNVDYAPDALVRSNGHVYRMSAGATRNSGPNAPSHVEGEQVMGIDAAGADYAAWTYMHSGHGVVRITAVGGGGTTATGTVLTQIPDSVVSAGTYKWSEGRWSVTRGFPEKCAFHEQRLVFSGTPADPLAVDLSVAGDIDSFDLGQAAGTDALSFRLPTTQRNGVNWLASNGRGLNIGTLGDEHLVRPSADGEALTPTNVNRRRMTNEGSANVTPIDINDAILFVAGDGRRLVEQAFNPNVTTNEQGFTTTDVDRLARHIARRGIVEMRYARNPLRIVWLRLADGGLASLTYRREEKMLAWARHAIAAADAIESIAVAPTTTGGEDELWLIVRRTVNGATRRDVERMQPFFDHDVETTAVNAKFVDAGLELSGLPASAFGGLEHLEDLHVTGIGDGRVLNTVQVKNGVAKFDRTIQNSGILGLAMPTPTLEILSPETILPDGPSTGRRRSVDSANLHVQASAGLEVTAYTMDGDDHGIETAQVFDEVTYPMPTGEYGAGLIPLKTGILPEIPTGGGSARRQAFVVRQPDPLPAKITGLGCYVTYEED